MRYFGVLTLAGILFFFPIALIYGLLSDWEWVGTLALAVCGGLSGMIGGYLYMVVQRSRPEPGDIDTAEIEDYPGEAGTFSPWSWWPLVVGLAVALVFAGLAIGWWMVGIGIVFSLVAVVGWCLEFWRGQHAH